MELADAYLTIDCSGIDRDVYLVLDDFGRMGCAWRETNVEDTDLEAVIQDLLVRRILKPAGWRHHVNRPAKGALLVGGHQRCN